MNWLEAAQENLKQAKARDAHWRKVFRPLTRKAIQNAASEARVLKLDYVGAEHLLLGLLKLDSGIAAKVLSESGLSYDAVRLEVVARSGLGKPDLPSSIPFTPRIQRILRSAVKKAEALGSAQVDTEHFLLGLLEENDGMSAEIFEKYHLARERMQSEVLKKLKE